MSRLEFDRVNVSQQQQQQQQMKEFRNILGREFQSVI